MPPLIESPKREAPAKQQQSTPAVERLEGTLPAIDRQALADKIANSRQWARTEQPSEPQIHTLPPLPRPTPEPGSFPTTDFAKELSHLFRELGLFNMVDASGRGLEGNSTLLQRITDCRFFRDCLEGGPSIDDRFGNGYASLSRRLLSILVGVTHDPEGKRGDQATHLIEGALAKGERFKTLLDGASAHGSEPTRHIVAILCGITSPHTEGGTPVFRSHYSGNPKTCADAETYFAKAIREGSYTKDPYFIYKSTGADTALSRVPMNIDGCVIPPGTLCHVERENGRVISVHPLRLTMFSVSEEMAKELYRSHYERATKSNGIKDSDFGAVYREIAPDVVSAPVVERPSLITRARAVLSSLFGSAQQQSDAPHPSVVD